MVSPAHSPKEPPLHCWSWHHNVLDCIFAGRIEEAKAQIEVAVSFGGYTAFQVIEPFLKGSPEILRRVIQKRDRPAMQPADWYHVFKDLYLVEDGFTEVFGEWLEMEGDAIRSLAPADCWEGCVQLLRNERFEEIKLLIPYLPWLFRGPGGLTLVRVLGGQLPSDDWHDFPPRPDILLALREYALTLRARRCEKLLGHIVDVQANIPSREKEAAHTLAMRRQGWITPDGLFLPATGFRHHKVLELLPAEHPIRQFVAPYIEELKRYCDAESRAYFASVPEGQHAEGHCIQLWESGMWASFSRRLTEFLYYKGWVRVGFKDNTIELSGARMGFEKCASFVRLFRELCETFHPGKTLRTQEWPLTTKCPLPDSMEGFGELIRTER